MWWFVVCITPTNRYVLHQLVDNILWYGSPVCTWHACSDTSDTSIIYKPGDLLFLYGIEIVATPLLRCVVTHQPVVLRRDPFKHKELAKQYKAFKTHQNVAIWMLKYTLFEVSYFLDLEDNQGQMTGHTLREIIGHLITSNVKQEDCDDKITWNY